MSREGSNPNVSPAAFGRFRVLQQVDADGLGPVFRGEAADTHQLVNIRYLCLGLNAERARAITEDLRALVGSLPDHPSVARVIDAGIYDNNPYIVTTSFDGDGLDAALHEYGPAVIGDALPRLDDLAKALDRAATLGVWHGALHPREIVVAGQLTGLMGLGIAPVLERNGVRLPSRPPYTAPEILEGRPSSAAADQYSFAVIAHEWLFGKRPEGPAETPVQVPHLPGVDVAALEGAFTSALAPNHADRFANCTAFVQAIRLAAQRVTPPLIATVGAPLPVRANGADPLDVTANEHVIHVAPAELSVADLQFDPEPEADLEPVLEPPQTPEHVANDDGRLEMAAAPMPELHAPEAKPVAPVAWNGALSLGAEPPDRPSRPRVSLTGLAAMLLAGVAIGVPAGYVIANRPTLPGALAELGISLETKPTPEAQSPTPGSARPGASSTEQVIAPSPRVPASSDNSSKSPAKVVAPAAAPAVATPGRLLVRSTPSGASVTIDGTLRGNTPLALRDLETGTRAVLVSRPGFVAAERRVTLTSDRPSRSLDVVLNAVPPVSPDAARPAATTTGILFVDSRPVGSTVTIDGREVGVTPLSLEQVPPGPHTVEIQRDGYKTWTTTVEVKAGERTRVAASLAGGQEEK